MAILPKIEEISLVEMRGAALRALIVSRHLSLGFRQLTASVLPHRKTRGVSAYGQAWYIGDSPSRRAKDAIQKLIIQMGNRSPGCLSRANQAIPLGVQRGRATSWQKIF
jgi:hypothetical protein